MFREGIAATDQLPSETVAASLSLQAMLPVTQRAATVRRHRSDKRLSQKLRLRHFIATSVGDAIISVINLLNKPAIDQLREPPRTVLAGDADVFCECGRCLDRQLLGIRQPRKDAVIGLSHPLGQVPYFHAYTWLHDRLELLFAYSYIYVLSLYGFVTSYNTDATHESSNDSPGALGAQKAPGRAWSRSDPVGRLTAMSEYEPSGLKARSETVASSGISFDASETLRGAYDNVRIGVAR